MPVSISASISGCQGTSPFFVVPLEVALKTGEAGRMQQCKVYILAGMLQVCVKEGL